MGLLDRIFEPFEQGRVFGIRKWLDAKYQALAEDIVDALDRSELGDFASTDLVLCVKALLVEYACQRRERFWFIPSISAGPMARMALDLINASTTRGLGEARYWWGFTLDPRWSKVSLVVDSNALQWATELHVISEYPVEQHDYYRAGFRDKKEIRRYIKAGIDANLAAALV